MRHNELMSVPVAVYVHTPFCPSKCGYCDFNSYAMDGEIIPRTVAAIEREIRNSPWNGIPAKTIFFGGGTPTFLSEGQLCGLLQAVIETHPPIEDCEITSEANPGTVDASKFKAMKQAGFNRVSIGAQSFQSDDLIRLDRIHAAGDIGKAVSAARSAGFENLNLDLMFALPHQSQSAWRSNLQTAIDLGPEHLSLYCLTIEENTRFYKDFHKGTLIVPDDEEQVAMYDIAHEMASEAGYESYEISNFAKPGKACLHNLCYWKGEKYAGYGPGAVGTMDGQNLASFTGYDGAVRYTNWKHPKQYSDSVESGDQIAFESENVSLKNLQIEGIFLGLRLAEGIERQLVLNSSGIGKCIGRGWLAESGERIKLTNEGRHFCTEVAVELT